MTFSTHVFNNWSAFCFVRLALLPILILAFIVTGNGKGDQLSPDMDSNLR